MPCRADSEIHEISNFTWIDSLLLFWDEKSTQKNCWCWVNLPSINRYISMNGVVTSKESHGRDARSSPLTHITHHHSLPFITGNSFILWSFFSAAAFWCEKSLLTKSNIFITSSILLIVLIPIDSSHRSLDSASWKHVRGQVKQWMSLEWQIRSQLHVRKFSLELTQRVKISSHENEIYTAMHFPRILRILQPLARFNLPPCVCSLQRASQLCKGTMAAERITRKTIFQLSRYSIH